MDKNDPHYAQHMAHCNTGEYTGSCKYGDEDCPRLDDKAALIARYAPLVERLPYPNRAAVFVNDTIYTACFRDEEIALNFAHHFFHERGIQSVVLVEFTAVPDHAPGGPVVLHSVTVMKNEMSVAKVRF